MYTTAEQERSRMIEENIGLVHACAHRFKGKGIEYDDLFQAGCMGLVKATDAFDTERGVRFSTYAVPVILGEMRRLFRDGGTVKVSRSLKELSMKVARQREQLSKRLGREPTVSELAAELAVSEESIIEALGAGTPPVSLTSEEDSAVLALIENLQRCDLHYLEEAAAIAKLIAQYGLSQEEAARRLGRSQSAVANKLRLLRLGEACAAALRQYNLTERHARAALRLEGEERQLAALRKMGEEQMNVAAAEAYVEELLRRAQRQSPPRPPIYVIKDVRLFLNSLRRGMDTIRRAGVNARYDKEENEEDIVITIHIPKGKPEAKTPANTAAGAFPPQG